MIKCKECGRDIDLNPKNLDHLIKRKGVCLLCWNAIAGKRYTYTPGQRVYFSPLPSPALGDMLIQEYVVSEFNKQTGANARTVKLEECKLLWDEKALVFWSLMNNKFMCPNNHPVIDIYPPREAHFLAKSGKKFTIPVQSESINIDLPEKFIVLHLRYIKNPGKGPEKDMLIKDAVDIINVVSNSGVKGFLIGNDIDMGIDLKNITDLRNKLNLGQIRYLMEKAFIAAGKDSGPLHIAAGASKYLLGYGYVDECWFPNLTPDEKGFFYMQNQGFTPFIEKLKELLILAKNP